MFDELCQLCVLLLKLRDDLLLLGVLLHLLLDFLLELLDDFAKFASLGQEVRLDILLEKVVFDLHESLVSKATHVSLHLIDLGLKLFDVLVLDNHLTLSVGKLLLQRVDLIFESPLGLLESLLTLGVVELHCLDLVPEFVGCSVVSLDELKLILQSDDLRLCILLVVFILSCQVSQLIAEGAPLLDELGDLGESCW